MYDSFLIKTGLILSWLYDFSLFLFISSTWLLKEWHFLLIEGPLTTHACMPLFLDISQKPWVQPRLLTLNFSTFLLSSDYTDLAMSTVTQRLSVAYTGGLPLLRYYLNQLSGDVEQAEVNNNQTLKVFKSVTVIAEPKMVVVEVRCLCLCIQ